MEKCRKVSFFPGLRFHILNWSWEENKYLESITNCIKDETVKSQDITRRKEVKFQISELFINASFILRLLCPWKNNLGYESKATG
jgi:hypothetical protein